MMQLKDFILQNANVLIISQNQKDYLAVQKYGFHNIKYFSSIEEASFYFNTIADLESYDIIMERSTYKKNGKSSFYYMLWELNRKKHIFVDLWKDMCLVNYKKERFISYDVLLDTVISSVENTKECLQSIMVRHLPQEKKEMKVLVVGDALSDWKKEEKYLNVSFSFLPLDLFTIPKFVKKSSKCDIVLMKYTVWKEIMAFDCSIIKEIQKRSCNFRVFATFQSFLQSEDCGEEKFSTIVGEKMQLDLAISDFNGDLDFCRKEYLVCEENGITVENSIVSVLGNVFRDTIFFKYAIKLDFDFMRVEEFEKLYFERLKMVLAWWKKAFSPVTDFHCFRNLLLEVFSNHQFISIPKDGNGVRILETKDKNGFVIENYVEGVLRGTLVISKVICENVEVRIQLVNGKGHLNSPVQVGIYPTFYEITEDMLPRMEEFPKEQAMYENIIRKATRMFTEAMKNQTSDAYQRERYRKKK